MFDANKCLDFARLVRLLAKSENLNCDLAGDLAGCLALTLLGLFDKHGMQTQANQKIGAVSVGLKHRRWRTIQSHCGNTPGTAR